MKKMYSCGDFGAFRKAVEMRVHVFTGNRLEPLFWFLATYTAKTKIAFFQLSR